MLGFWAQMVSQPQIVMNFCGYGCYVETWHNDVFILGSLCDCYWVPLTTLDTCMNLGEKCVTYWFTHVYIYVMYNIECSRNEVYHDLTSQKFKLSGRGIWIV